jgi:hypothetical protein
VSTEPNLRGVSSLPADQADIRRQQEIAKYVRGLLPEFSEGRLVPGSLTDANETSVTHGLKRAPRGWFLIAPSGSADRVSVIQTGADTNVVRLKNLGATGGLSFSLWVF